MGTCLDKTSVMLNFDELKWSGIIYIIYYALKARYNFETGNLQGNFKVSDTEGNRCSNDMIIGISAYCKLCYTLFEIWWFKIFKLFARIIQILHYISSMYVMYMKNLQSFYEVHIFFISSKKVI